MTATEPRRPLLPDGTEALAPFVEAGLLREAEVQVAGAVARAVPDTVDEVLLAVALCVRALQHGHVCVLLDDAATAVAADEDVARTDGAIDLDALPWPDPATWGDALRASDAVAVRDPDTGGADPPLDPSVVRPLVFDGARVYLERYWRFERAVGDALLATPAPTSNPEAGRTTDAVDEATLDRYFGTEGTEPDLQRRAAAVALHRRVAVVAGGPGTGKTYTVARLLAAGLDRARAAGRPLEVALAAPTGKAAARMTEAVHGAATDAGWDPAVVARLAAIEATTLHRLLGSDRRGRFRRGAADPLPHDLVVVDETSMVDLPLMAALLSALRPDARLVLVGDPHQLASVEAGAVLGDVVGPAARGATADGPLAASIVVLDRVHRFGAESAIAALADAVRTGDADGALAVLADPAADDVAWIDPADAEAVAALRGEVIRAAGDVVRAARDGDAAGALAAATDVKVLCGTRHGPLGTYAWQDLVEARLAAGDHAVRTDHRWYVGRPVIVTRNDALTGVHNGDTGVVVDDDGRPVVAMPAAGDDHRRLAPVRLDAVDTWWAMTIHKSQGSEVGHAVVSLPDARSRVLTNELLYTGITRGRRQVTVVASEEALRAAIGRPVSRASGLGERLWG